MGAGVVDEERLAVRGAPEVSAGSDDAGGEPAVGLGAVVAAAKGPELWGPVWPGGPVSS